jgi:hypothetical protein
VLDQALVLIRAIERRNARVADPASGERRSAIRPQGPRLTTAGSVAGATCERPSRTSMPAIELLEGVVLVHAGAHQQRQGAQNASAIAEFRPGHHDPVPVRSLAAPD